MVWFTLILCIILVMIVWALNFLNDDINRLSRENEWLIEQIEYIKARLGE